MAPILVIVESPAKCGKIEKFLGRQVINVWQVLVIFVILRMG